MITLIRCGKLIDGIQSQPISDGLVVIDNKMIAYAGSYSPEVESRYTAGEHQWLDAAGKTVMPGLIDAHIHLTMYGGPHNINNFLMDSAAFTAYKALNGALRCLEAGFTTVRCLGEKSEVDIGLKQAIHAGLIKGPRILASGKCLTITGGHGDMYPGEVALDTIGEVCDGIEEVRRITRKRLKFDCDCIKLMATGGGNSSGPGTVSQMNEDEMRAAVYEAEKRGKITAAHCIGCDGIKNAVRAGVRTIEHGSFIDDEGIALMLEKGAYLVPTLCAFRTIKYGPEGGVPPHVLEKIHFFATAHYNGLEKAIRAGVKIVCGTDTGTPFNYPGEEAEELELYTKHGLTPMQAIQSATSVAAEALKLEDTGSLIAGKAADLLIIDGDPIATIAVLQDKSKIKTVMRNGEVLISRA